MCLKEKKLLKVEMELSEHVREDMFAEVLILKIRIIMDLANDSILSLEELGTFDKDKLGYRIDP